VFGNSVQIGASCGLVDCAGHPERDASELLRYADLALFAAKRGGRAQVRLFDADLDLSQQFRQRIETGLNQAIGRDELRLHYQPIVERETLDVVGYEALLRWTSHEHGEVPPGVFIPIAEESTLIHRLGDWVVEHALRDAAAWPGKFIAINFSPRQFKAANFAERLAAEAAKRGVAPQRIQVEITETALFQDVERASRVLEHLRAQGFRIALDDFGTGYSNMFNLKNFTVDCIKIDRSFVSDLGRDRESAAIVSAIAQLARGLGLTIVAEGVEQPGQADLLRTAGCSHMQGYMFGRAQPLADLDEDRPAADRHKASG
jgi:EAL domain-containing protein (putative c-di-GMP-specific phosphodiesterase class I)